MELCELFKQYLQHLFLGKRCEAREVVLAAHDRGVTAGILLQQIIWPASEQVDKLYRDHHIDRITEHMASRINRMLADQLHAVVARKPKTGRRAIVVSGEGEVSELNAQITSDLLEGEGFHVWFMGAGVPNDEILQFAGKINPDLLCICGAQPGDIPDIRRMIALIREVGVCQDMQVMTVGGVFARAPGLTEEVRAELHAASPGEAVRLMQDHPVRIPLPDMPEPGRRRKRRRATVVPAHRGRTAPGD
jgi:methanogenic corrinoid protein MtbC1